MSFFISYPLSALVIIEVLVPRHESGRLCICAQCFFDLILEFFQQCGIVVDFINRNCSNQNIYVIFYLRNQYIYRLLHAIFHVNKMLASKSL
jgi:hypothetical protein